MRPAADSSNEFLAALTAGKVDLREQGVLVVDPFGNGLVSGRNARGYTAESVTLHAVFSRARDIESTAAIESV